MSRLPRKAIPAPKGKMDELVEENTDLIKSENQGGEEVDDSFLEITKSEYVPLAKADPDEMTITGIAMEPDAVDAHGDFATAAVIKKAAHNFLAAYNKTVKLGVQHKDFKPKFQILESYVAPVTFVLGNRTVKEGSWIVTVKVLNADIWKKIKNGSIKGFSIGGKAKVRNVKKTELV
jgi:hypothetical protein